MDRSNSEACSGLDATSASMGRNASSVEQANASGHYVVECVRDGEVVWTDTIENLVTTAGKNDALDKYLAGSAYTAAWYLGLIDSTSYSAVAVGDTSASHSGWTENTGYTQGARPTTAWSAASAGSKALSSALTFSINANATVKGCFLISNSTKGGTTGILYSAGLFTGGDKVVQNGDTLNVSYTASL
ncbi:MAG: hypothetical protein ACJ75S_06755 [Solirubrobacterales bacterium]|jgi:hypothetical protein